MRDTTGALAAWLAQGGTRFGQISIRAHPDVWVLSHADDMEGEGARYDSWRDARMLANFDDAGNYRPLKTAPNLRHGWELWLHEIEEMLRALDYFYPGMLGVWLAEADGELAPVHLRETLGRQTGMYRVTQNLTDGQAQALISRTCCASACLKTILWRVDAGVPVASLPPEKFTPAREGSAMPLLCHEACNLLVAAARKAVKGEVPGDE